MRRPLLLTLGLFLWLPTATATSALAANAAPDTSAPVTHMLPPGADPSTVEDLPQLAWRSDDESSIASYDLRVSRTPMRSPKPAAWAYPETLAGVTVNTVRLHVARGYTLCVQARARDTAGNVEPWRSGSYTCAVRALDDSDLPRSGSIQIVHNDAFYTDGRASVLRYGARRWLGGVPKGSMVGVLLTTRPEFERVLSWRFPGLGRYCDGAPAKLRHGVFVTLDNRSTRDGRVTIFQPYHYRTVPFEGLTVIPHWVTAGYS